MVTSLTNVANVKRTGRLNDVDGFTDADIGSEIEDVSLFLFSKYGNPVKRYWFDIDDDYDTYDFTGDDNPVYSITKVILSGTLSIGGYSTGSDITDGSDYTSDLDKGELTFTDTFLTDYEGKRITVEFIPQTFELLARYYTVINLYDDTGRNAGEDSAPTFVDRMIARKNAIEKELAPRLASLSSRKQKREQTSGVEVEQDRFVKPMS